jgi:hypothetical protein
MDLKSLVESHLQEGMIKITDCKSAAKEMHRVLSKAAGMSASFEIDDMISPDSDGKQAMFSISAGDSEEPTGYLVTITRM